MSAPAVTSPVSDLRSPAGENRPVVCRHCGAPLADDRLRATGFCCAGCAYVFRLVHEHGLEGYYRIKDEVTAPADGTVFQPRDFSWLETAQRAAEAAPGGRVPELTVDLQGISCAGCVWLIERIFQQQPGARDIVANAQFGQARLRWVAGEFSAAAFAQRLQSFGYLLGPAGESAPASESRGLVKRIGLCGAFAMNIMLFAFPVYFGMPSDFEYARLFGLLTLGFGTLSFLVGGTYFVGRAVRALREGALHLDLPIAIGILGAYLGSLYGWIADEPRFVYFDFVGTFVLLMLIGRWAQVAAVERNQRRLLRQHAKPRRVRLADGAEIAPEQLCGGEVFFIAPGQTVPVEATLDSADASFSLASINGESEPRIFRAGARVPAGAVNLGRGEVRLTARQPWAESLLAQLLRPAERAGARHDFLERIIRGYLLGILVVALLAGIGWWLAGADAPRTWSIVTAVLVVSCPCAIGLAFPLADEMATVALRRRGVFVRDADLFAKLGRVRNLVFDKTGTLTLETPVLRNPAALAALDPTALAALFVLVRDNSHPVSQSLLETLLANGGPAELPATEVRETIGQGVEFSAGGQVWSLGRPGWKTTGESSSAKGRRPPAIDTPPDVDDGPGDVELACDGVPLARFHFADKARSDARVELAALGALGFRSFILSGDRPAKVAALAQELALPADHALGGLSPQEKSAWLDAHAPDDALMLGDGANDSLAFDRALCRGTPVIHRGILEQKADFYYLGRGIGGLRALFAVDRLRRRTQLWVLVFSVVYNAVAVGLAIAGRMNPLVAAILMPVNSLLTLVLVSGGMRAAFRA